MLSQWNQKFFIQIYLLFNKKENNNSGKHKDKNKCLVIQMSIFKNGHVEIIYVNKNTSAGSRQHIIFLYVYVV